MNFPKNASKKKKRIVLLYVSNFKEKKKIFVNISPILLARSKHLHLNFPQHLPLFKHVKKNKLSEYFSAPFGDSHILDQKEKFSVYFPENATKQQKSID